MPSYVFQDEFSSVTPEKGTWTDDPNGNVTPVTGAGKYTVTVATDGSENGGGFSNYFTVGHIGVGATLTIETQFDMPAMGVTTQPLVVSPFINYPYLTSEAQWDQWVIDALVSESDEHYHFPAATQATQTPKMQLRLQTLDMFPPDPTEYIDDKLVLEINRERPETSVDYAFCPLWRITTYDSDFNSSYAYIYMNGQMSGDPSTLNVKLKLTRLSDVTASIAMTVNNGLDGDYDIHWDSIQATPSITYYTNQLPTFDYGAGFTEGTNPNQSPMPFDWTRAYRLFWNCTAQGS